MDKRTGRPVVESGRVRLVRLEKIRPNPAQPRRVFDPEGLQELASSIGQYGILQPLTVRRTAAGLELVAGERRLRAAKLAGLKEVPCIFVTADEIQSGMLALVENLQRRDLDYIEEAEGLARLMRLFGLSQEQAAQKVGKSQSAVANKLRLLRHSPQVLDALRSAGLTERHARALLKLNKDEDKLAAIGLIAQRGLTVAQTEQYVQDMLSDRVPGTRRRRPPDIREFLNDLTQSLALIQSAGVAAVSRQQETDREITLTITIPKCAG